MEGENPTLTSAESYKGSCFKKYQDHILHSFAKLVCIDDRFNKLVVLYRGENAAYKFIEVILEEYEYCKKVMKKHFNKNLIMTEDEENVHSSNTCLICEKLIEDDKVRDHGHINRKFRGTTHWNCKINI